MSVTGTTFAASVGRGFLCCFSPISVACGAARPAVADYRSKFALDSPFRCAWSPLAGSDEFGELTSVHRRLLLGMSGCPRSERIPPSSQVLRHRNQRVWKEPVPARLSVCPSSKHLAVGILVNQRHVKQKSAAAKTDIALAFGRPPHWPASCAAVTSRICGRGA
jgi:hypothetical protein